ncbi:MAG: hypothetical protein ACLR4A_18720 [Christensenellales bacterium]
MLREVISAAVIGRILSLTGCILIFEGNAGVANFALRLEHKGHPSADACNRNSFDVFHIVRPFKALFSLNARIFVMQLKAKFNSRRF